MGEVAMLPNTPYRDRLGAAGLRILCLEEAMRAVMEAIGRYHEPVASALHESDICVCIKIHLF